jgi:hypothetical protein
MPVVVIVVSMLLMLVATTPAEASESCLSRTEARQHSGSVHIHWRGNDHCRDATPTRRQHQLRNVQRKYQVHQAERKMDQLKWHDAMSEMLPDDEAVPAPWVDRRVDIESPLSPIVARRVGIVEVKPPPVVERKPGPVVSPRAVVLVFIAFILALTLATIELLFRGMIYERPDR